MIAIVLAICVVVIIVLIMRPRQCELSGFWEADDSYKEQANLTDFYMYIGKEIGRAHV